VTRYTHIYNECKCGLLAKIVDTELMARSRTVIITPKGSSTGSQITRALVESQGFVINNVIQMSVINITISVDEYLMTS